MGRQATPRPPAQAAWALRVALLVAYPVLAHLASTRGDGRFAALALLDLALLGLVEPLLRPRAWAWLALAAAAVALWWLARSPLAQLPLLLVPVAFIALIAWTFARTLRAGSVPLVTRIVAALDKTTPDALAPGLRAYTTNLTRGWAGMLGALALCNLALAAVAVPGGLLAGMGIAPPYSVTESQWSWFANVLNYGFVGGFFLLEYLYRKRRFPGRYRNFADFARRMAGLGPAFWRDVWR